jgi:hypothetical protein
MRWDGSNTGLASRLNLFWKNYLENLLRQIHISFQMLAPSRGLLCYLREACHHQLRASRIPNGRSFSTTATLASGHSKWATIKHDKARVDAKKNRQRSMLSQQIELISKCTIIFLICIYIHFHSNWDPLQYTAPILNPTHASRVSSPTQNAKVSLKTR